MADHTKREQTQGAGKKKGVCEGKEDGPKGDCSRLDAKPKWREGNELTRIHRRQATTVWEESQRDADLESTNQQTVQTTLKGHTEIEDIT